MKAKWVFRILGLSCLAASPFFGVSIIKTPMGFLLTYAGGLLMATASNYKESPEADQPEPRASSPFWWGREQKKAAKP